MECPYKKLYRETLLIWVQGQGIHVWAYGKLLYTLRVS